MILSAPSHFFSWKDFVYSVRYKRNLNIHGVSFIGSLTAATDTGCPDGRGPAIH